MAHINFKLPSGTDRLANSQYAMTLEEIGQVLGITRQAVEQIEKRALKKLGAYRSRELKQMRDMANEMRRSRGSRGTIASGEVRVA